MLVQLLDFGSSLGSCLSETSNKFSAFELNAKGYYRKKNTNAREFL